VDLIPRPTERVKFESTGSTNSSGKKAMWKTGRLRSNSLIQACRRLPSPLAKQIGDGK
jgi:hypothetical protein